MQTKTINKNIKAKMEEWLKTITDQGLRGDVQKNLLVSGGSITSMFLGEPVNDYDVFIQDIDVLKCLIEYYVKPFGIVIFDGRKKQALVDEIEKAYHGLEIDDIYNQKVISLRNLKDDQIKLYMYGGSMRVNEDKKPEELNYQPVFFSPNAISLSNDIQIVCRFWGNHEKIHSTFDFIHATNYYTTESGVVLNIAALESLLTKQLKYQGSFYPLTSIIRARKFIKRGWNIGAGELLKIMYQISQLNLNNPDVLYEQLIGVDVAYFSTLIAILQGKQGDPNFKMTYEYLSDLIDKVFNDER